MGALGRGLASLIPKRSRDNAEEVLDQIDHMEFEMEVSDAGGVAKVVEPAVGLKDFEQLEEMENMPMPVKSPTTPLPFDPFEEEGGAQAVLERLAKEKAQRAVMKKKLLKVQEETDEVVAAAQVMEEVAQAVVEEVVETPAPEAPAPEVEAPGAADEPEESAEPKMEAKAAVEAFEEEEVAAPEFGEGAGSGWDKHEQSVEHIAIGDIKINPLQPRRTFDPQELEELAQSISQHGILQPLVVRRLSHNEGFELIAGERRLRAAKKLGWERVPCVVRKDVKSDQSRLVFALIENIQRQNLDPIEEALAYKQLNEEYGLTHEEIGQRMGKSRVAVTNIVRILQLPAEIQRGLTEGKITVGHAKAILMVPDEEKQIKFYHHLLDEGLTVRKAEVRARRIQRTMNLHDPLRQRGKFGKHPLALKYTPALEERYGFDAKIGYVDNQNKFEILFWAHNETEVEDLVGKLLGTKPLETNLDKDVMDA
ncbi:MAG: ParB/RepB/Spo0J family partition protein [Candidatus Andersenbacteria bacterium]|nr:ParB/RepB/Spo0J family partition protein [Candidatus Andersenbacteria bacterium]